MSEFHRVEGIGVSPKSKYVIVSFKTTYRGIWQCKYAHNGLTKFAGEPPFESLSAESQKEVETVGPYIFYLTYGEWPESLSERSA